MSVRKKDRERPTSAIFLRLSPEDRRRFRRVCVDLDCTYADFVMRAVSRAEAKPVVKSPLHVDIEDDDW